MIKVNKAVKVFGNKTALNDISFTVEEGQIVGILGTNGAGKSTMLKAIAGLLHLDRGDIDIDENSTRLTARAKIAYLPDVDVWYSWMKLSDAIRYMKDIYWDWDDTKSRKLMEFLELKENWLIQDVSKGTRAKMKLLLALSRQSKYLLLDEPFSGIDPFARKLIAQAIVEDFIEEEQTILITTHELTEIENMLDKILFMHEGNLLLSGNVDTLKQEKNQPLLDTLQEVFNHARF